MKIALFSETYLPYINGVVTHVKLLKEGLEKLGHEVLIVTADPHAKHHYIEQGILHCPSANLKKMYGYGLASPVSTKRLRLIQQFDPDVIHIHTEFGVGLSGAMIAKILKKPLVYTLHTMYDQYLYYVAPKPFIPLLKKTSHKYFKMLARSATSLTGPSKKVEEYFKQCGVEKEVVVIRNPVELDIFEPGNISEEKKHAFRSKYQIDQDTMLICFCGRLGREKSVNVLLDYFAKTVDRRDNIQLLIIGDGPAKQELEQQAKQLGIDDLVVFTGKVMHEDMPPFYASCDMYVTASVSDTNSISMLEAMATGLPVVHITDELNHGQIIPGVNGYVYRTPKQMYQSFLEYRAMPADQKQAFVQSVRNSVTSAGAQDLAKTLLKVYDKQNMVRIVANQN